MASKIFCFVALVSPAMSSVSSRTWSSAKPADEINRSLIELASGPGYFRSTVLPG